MLQKLGYRVRPVLAVPAEVFARLELRRKREVMRLVKQLERAGGGAVAAPEDDGPAFQQWESREVSSGLCPHPAPTTPPALAAS